ncbi:MAG: NAD(P)-dependent oxidoreductase [Peptococcaceae bacterium]|nr:NAD(P)-dependent oxidoreductase [Peptococcaceae bacterium]
MPKVLCLRPEKDFADVGVNIPSELQMVFVEPGNQSEILAACNDADFILAAKDGQITAEMILNASHLRLIQLTCTGFDHVDILCARRLNIPVANNGGSNAYCVAQFVLMAISILRRRIIEADRGVKYGRFLETRSMILERGLFDFTGEVVGILGFGRIGREVAKVVKALGARIVYHDVLPLSPEEEREFSARLLELPDLLRTCDVLTIHMPLTPRTRRLIGPVELSLMKGTAVLINTGRGAIVDDAALAEAIKNNVIAGAAIDTFEQIPSLEHPYLKLEHRYQNRLLLTPHIAGATKQSFKNMLTFSLENILNVVNNRQALSVVN